MGQVAPVQLLFFDELLLFELEQEASTTNVASNKITLPFFILINFIFRFKPSEEEESAGELNIEHIQEESPPIEAIHDESSKI